MTSYALAYRLRFTPWERYATAAARSIAHVLDREEADRARPLGRALDLGCGRGVYTAELARRGWQAVGVDNVPAAIEAARDRRLDSADHVVGDVTDLPAARLGTFDFFLDIGCFQGLDRAQRREQARGVTASAEPGATLLMLAFGPTPLRSLVGGVSKDDVETAFAGWDLLAVDPASTAGLGWPMSRTSPQWYRLRLRAPAS